MRLWQLGTVVLFTALFLAIGRSEVGRVGLVIFFTAIAEVVVGTAALMQLFRTLGALGAARGLADHVEAIAATALVLMVGSAGMNGVLWVGLLMLSRILDW